MPTRHVSPGRRGFAAKAKNASTATKAAANMVPQSRSDAAVPLAKASLVKLATRNPDVGRALNRLAAEGKLAGGRSGKISARVDPGIFAAAAAQLGLAESDVSDVVNASLAIAAAPDRFKAWLRDSGDALPEEFELAI